MQLLRLAFALGLAVLSLAVAVSPGLAYRLVSFRPFGRLDPADLTAPPPVDDQELPQFFAERNRVALIVPREMTARDLLKLYQIDFMHVRREIAGQMGLPELVDETLVPAGRRLEITLTPPEDNLP